MAQIVLIIPALNPDQNLIRLARSLMEKGFSNIYIINDGSQARCLDIFRQAEEMGCRVVTHETNRGKGAAIKTGISAARQRFGAGNFYVTADADGQHLPEDIARVAVRMLEEPEALTLGIRSFDGDNVPWKSRMGNRITSLIFRLTNGITCPDTQTGLRGIPPCLEELAACEEGERYEYEMNFLADAVKQVALCFVPITTVYQNQNKGSHFRPFADSLLVYRRFLRFTGASLAGALTDLVLFSIFCMLPAASAAARVVVATVPARLSSGAVNYLLNRCWSFKSSCPAGGEAMRYGILFLCQMAASAGFTAALTLLHVPSLPAKIVVDSFLFFLSYVIQKNWVFRKEKAN